jgi:hypothetical protein
MEAIQTAQTQEVVVDKTEIYNKTFELLSDTKTTWGVTKKPLLLTLVTDIILERVSGNWIERGELANATYPG